MRPTRYLIPLLLAGSLLGSATVSQGATVRGQLVFASNNAPAAYVAVRLNAPGKGPSEFAYSGSNGRFYLPNVPAGNYQLEVWRGGKTVVTVQVTVQEPNTELTPVRVP
jgi:hypothetical protein